jgi:hypothetical protein
MAGRCYEIKISNEIITNEIPDGSVNSSNKDFELLNTPVIGTVEVYLGGLIQSPGAGLDYTISGKTILFIKAPRNNSELLVSYIKDN